MSQELDFEKAIEQAANLFTIPGMKGKRYRDRARAFVIVEPFLIPIEPQDYHVDSRPVVIQRNRVMRLRPCFPKWNLRFQIRNLDSQLLPNDKIGQFLEYAGRLNGVGDYRPKYGRFAVTHFKVSQD